jgi:hypothetical protein
MKITCPDCGKVTEVATGHPPRLNIPVTTLCDTLAHSKDVLTAANTLKCSKAYIYRELKAVGKKPKDYLRR